MNSVAPIANLIQKTTWNFTPASCRMSSQAWAVFTSLHKVHQLWRRYSETEIYTNPANFYKLATGYTLSFIVGDKTVIKIAAQCILIASRILACIEQQKNLHQAYEEFKNNLQSKYPLRSTYKWTTEQTFSIVSPSSVHWWRSKIQILIVRIQNIVLSFFRFGCELFKLSMYLLDAVEAFSLNPKVGEESVREIFINADNCLDQLVTNKKLLLDELNNNKEIVQEVLTYMRTSYKVESLIEAVTTAMSVAETVQQVVNFDYERPKEICKILFSGLIGRFDFDNIARCVISWSDKDRFDPGIKHAACLIEI